MGFSFLRFPLASFRQTLGPIGPRDCQEPARDETLRHSKIPMTFLITCVI